MLEIGQVLQARYQLQEKLGQNAGRQTWLAEDLTTQPHESVIVKLLTFGDQVQWDSLKLFEREADILKQLNHPQIPKYRDYFSIDDRILWFGLVQDYIPGSSLKELLVQGQKFSEKQIRKIATDILDILVYLHELSPTVLHRDIKPSNLILGKDERVYLVDFGAVQDRAMSERATFTVIGTYGYAPTEQFGGRAVPASDLYALGATLIHLLTGVAPADLPQRKMRIQFSDRVSVSPNLVSWIETLTEPDVDDRFSTARQAIEALNNPHNPKTHHPVYKPYNSRIQVKKTFNQLDIKIPQRGAELKNIFWVLFIQFFVCLAAGLSGAAGAPFTLLILLVGTILSLSRLIDPLTVVDISFLQDNFVIKWSVLGKKYRELTGKTSAIYNVYVYIYHPSSRNNLTRRDQMKIIIATDTSKHIFGEFDFKSAEAECLWLVQEMKDWLDLKL